MSDIAVTQISLETFSVIKEIIEEWCVWVGKSLDYKLYQETFQQSVPTPLEASLKFKVAIYWNPEFPAVQKTNLRKDYVKETNKFSLQ